MITADLSGKAVLVTGGTSGIGLAAVELFAKCGAKVAANHLAEDNRAPDEVARLKSEGLNVIGVPGSVAKPGEAERMVGEAIGKLGQIDILINNAGTPGSLQPIDFADLDAMTEEFWQLILSTNLVGPFRCAHAAASELKKTRGAIVNTASVAGLGRRGSSMAYGASKAGVINLTKGLARALAPEVRVNAVAPGLVDTPWTNPWPDERKKATLERTLLAKTAQPSDIAQAMLFLAVHTHITGETVVVDGGFN